MLTTKDDKTGLFFYKILCSCDVIFEIKYLHSYPLLLPKHKKKDVIQLTLNMTCCLTPRPLTHKQPKHPERTRINKIRLVAFPNWFFTQTLQYQNLKSNKYYILIKLGPSVSEFSTNISYFYAPTDSEQKFHKTGVKNWLPIGFELGLPLIGYLLL